MNLHIDGRDISTNDAPFIVAELSGNHGGEITQALKMIKAAKDAGASAVKIQTYSADSMTIDHDGPEFRLNSGLWKGKTLYELYSEAHTPWEWLPELFEFALRIGIVLFSSPFDKYAVDVLESLGCPAYKIASFELVDIPLVERVAQTGKPMIMSTGMATLQEIHEAVSTARSAGATEIALLHCTSAYPAPYSACHLRNLPALREEFKLPVGLSDHTQGIVAPVAAVALGASIIEKHFILSRAEGGVDASFSLEPQEFQHMVSACNHAWEALGDVGSGIKAGEESSHIYRRSLYVVEDIKKGEVFTASNMRSIRPGLGLHTRYYEEILGKRCQKDASRGTPMEWGLVEPEI